MNESEIIEILYALIRGGMTTEEAHDAIMSRAKRCVRGDGVLIKQLDIIVGQ